jgi:Orsellinic acid/F9775 biosynthesis cluster protein D
MPTAVSSASQTPPPEELLQYLSLYRVVVCTSCRYAVQPKAIARHLKEIHRIKGSDRQSYMHYVERFELADHELVLRYVPSEFPVPLLPVYSGLQCRAKDCAYLCMAEKRMKHHWLSDHGRQGLESCDWQTALIQTFFKGNLLRYFTSTTSGKSSEITARSAHQDRKVGRTVCYNTFSELRR